MQPAFNLLHSIVGNGHRAQRHAPMTPAGTSKYYTVHQPLTDDQIAAHLTGSATYAVPLIGVDELASAGLIEQDAGGIDMAQRILDAADRRGVVMFAIVCKGSGGHDGCHAWALYDGRYDPAAIRQQLKRIAQDAGASTDEIHPNKTNIRLPFGLHLRTNTRGRTLLQSGELFENDTELDAAERAVLNLPLNGQPPAVTKVTTLVSNIHKQVEGDTMSPSRIPGRASLADVKAQFNAAHTLEQLLTDDGAHATRDGYTCPHCQHTHATTLYISKQGRLFSYSPNCLLATTKGYDPFGYYVKTRHNDNVVDALKTLNPIEPAKPVNNINTQPARYTDEQRAAYNAARRATRHQETRQALDAIYDANCNLDMPDYAHLLFAYLLSLCYERGVLQVAPTNEQLSSDLDMCKRYVQYAFRALEEKGLGKRQGGRNIEGNVAATWTFYRSPNLGCKAHQDAECTLSIYKLDLVLDQYLAREAAPALPPDDLDTWAWQEDSHGADELSALDYLAETPKIAEPEATAAEMTDRARRAFVARFAPKPGQIFDQVFDDSDQAEGATYTPVELLPMGNYTGTARQYMPESERRRLALDSMRIRETPHDDAIEQIELPEPEPEVLVPPTDPQAADRYYKLLGKAAKASSPGQRVALERKAAQLLVYVPALDVAGGVMRAPHKLRSALSMQQAFS